MPRPCGAAGGDPQVLNVDALSGAAEDASAAPIARRTRIEPRHIRKQVCRFRSRQALREGDAHK
jgi:hypothetical protein